MILSKQYSLRVHCFFVAILLTSFTTFAQPAKQGKLVTKEFTALSIENNRGGEDAQRQVTVYLPPSYDNSTERFPVVYFLHGYGGDGKGEAEWLKIRELMDSAIAAGKLKPFIIVAPSSMTRFRGSFYANSSLTGSWSDYIAKDVVTFIDKNFRTIPDRKSRGLAGHSMGGNGTLRLVMLFPEVFSAAYALSPAVLDWYGDFTIRNKAFKRISKVNNEQEIVKGVDEFFTTWDEQAFFAGVFTAMARTFSPDETNLPLQAAFPISYKGDSAVLNLKAIQEWEKHFPTNMIEEHLSALKSLTALKLDWGRNEDFPHIPFTALQFSKKLETFRVKHFAEEYIGDHASHIAGFEGRFYTSVLPFFDTYLEFDKAKAAKKNITAKRK